MVIIIGSFLFDFSKRYTKYSFPYYFFCISVLILVAGLRYRVGSDTLIYQNFFETVPPISRLNYIYIFFNNNFEPGWIVFNSLIKSFGLNFYSLQLLHAIFLNSVIGILIWKVTKYRYLSLFCYVIILYPNFNFEIMRQSISISFFIWGYFKLIEKKYALFYFLISLALIFHYSAVILIFIPFIERYIAKLIFRPFILLIISIMIYGTSLLFKVAIGDLMLLLPIVEDKAFIYFSDMEESTFNISFIYNLVLNVGVPIYIIQYVGKYYLRYKDNNVRIRKRLQLCLSICCISVMTYCLSSTLPIFYRLQWYFLPFGVLLYPYIVDILGSFGFNLKYGILLFFILLMFKGRVYFTKDVFDVVNYEKYYPYSSIFNEFKDTKRELHFGA